MRGVLSIANAELLIHALATMLAHLHVDLHADSGHKMSKLTL